MIVCLVLSGCVGSSLPPAPPSSALASSEYKIGTGDKLHIEVWRNPELTSNVPVRPDGRISVPLANDIVAVGKTPTELAQDIEHALSKYVRHPIVTVIDTSFAGPFARQIRVIGEAVRPRALPYSANMTLLDAMIAVGGLTKYAAGNRAILIRTVNRKQKSYRVYLDSLINDGDMKDNVALAPGDILVIPQSYF